MPGGRSCCTRPGDFMFYNIIQKVASLVANIEKNFNLGNYFFAT